MMAVELYAYQYSVYAWIVRLVLAEKRVDYEYVEVNPFTSDVSPAYLAMHPFRRVPTLVHDNFILYETATITRYIDDAFPGAALQPVAARSRARMTQIICVVDAYGYWPMARQVFSHRVFRPRTGLPTDENEIRSGVEASARVLDALETLAADDGFLVGGPLSLADLHLAPMMAYFAAAEEGRAMLARRPKLSAWWEFIRSRPALIETEPKLPG